MTSTNAWFKKYMDLFETNAQDWSKELFKRLKLHHWSEMSKMGLTLVIIIMPICFIFIGCVALAMILCYNRLALVFYDRKIAKL